MYQFNSRIRYSEVGANSKLTIPALLDYFQNCSTFHGEDTGVGIEPLLSRNEAWFLSSWQICINDLPSLGEEVEIQTWPYAIKSFLGYRNYAMQTPDGKRLAYANSLWVFMDTKKGCPKKVSQDILLAFPFEEPIAMDCCDRKIPLPDQMEAKEPVLVRNYFIDTNHHMNNSKYVMVAAEYLPDDFVVGELRVEYKSSAGLGDILYPFVSVAPDRITVALNNEEQKPYAIIVFLSI